VYSGQMRGAAGTRLLGSPAARRFLICSVFDPTFRPTTTIQSIYRSRHGSSVAARPVSGDDARTSMRTLSCRSTAGSELHLSVATCIQTLSDQEMAFLGPCHQPTARLDRASLEGIDVHSVTLRPCRHSALAPSEAASASFSAQCKPKKPIPGPAARNRRL